jgi:tetratricopeptide (TPR) repeat protein
MCALEKDRTRRYDTASALASDVQRHLKEQPVHARPPTIMYRFGKFARRNKAGLAIGISFVCFLLLATIVSSFLALRAMRAERLVGMHLMDARRAKEDARGEADKARTEADISAAILEFLNNDLLAQADPLREPEPDVQLRTVLDRAAERIEGRFETQPLVEAAIRTVIAETYSALRETAKANRQWEAAFRLQRDHLGDTHELTLKSKRSIAWNYTLLGRADDGARMLEEVLAVHEKAFGGTHPETIASMARLSHAYGKQGRQKESIELSERTVAISRATWGADDPGTLKWTQNLANGYRVSGWHEKSVKLHEEVLARQRATLGPTDPQVLRTLRSLAKAHRSKGNFEGAVMVYEEALPLHKDTFGPNHPDTIFLLESLAETYADVGRREEAFALLEELIERMKVRPGLDDDATIATLEKMADHFLPATVDRGSPRRQLGSGAVYFGRVIERVKREVEGGPAASAARAKRFLAFAELLVGIFNATAAEEGNSSRPFGEGPVTVPGLIEAEEFDHGPLGVAYFDRTLMSTGPGSARYRPLEMVDFDVCGDGDAGLAVADTRKGEWLAYSVAVARTGEYDVALRVSCPAPGGQLHLEFGSEDVTGPLDVPQTGGWRNWQTITKRRVPLKEGRQVMRVVFDREAAIPDQWNVCNLDLVRITPSDAPGK